SVERENVTKQRNQRPRLLRVPAPESSPGIIRPNTAENRARSEQEHTELKDAIKPEMHWSIRARCCGIACIPPEQNMTETHCERERGIAQSDRQHMNGEPKIVPQ